MRLGKMKNYEKVENLPNNGIIDNQYAKLDQKTNYI